MDDRLLSREALDDAEWAVTPHPDHLVPDAIKRERTREAFQDALRDGPPAIVLTHIDADGLSSAALLVDHEGVATAVQPLSYHGAYRFEHALDDIQRADLETATPIYIADFNADSRQQAARVVDLARQGHDITWYDHHQWDGAIVQQLRDGGVDLLLDDDQCTASLIAQAADWPIGDYLRELVAVTKDIDLRIHEDPRSERLHTFARICDGAMEYIGIVLHCGVAFPDDVEERIDERIERDEWLEALAVDNRVCYDVGPYTVGVTYVRGGRSSEIGTELAETPAYGIDIAVVLKPPGGMGIYAHSNRETFARCHEIAEQLGGGGHPTAAGCAVPVDRFRELARYWATAGDHVHDAVLDAVRAVVSEDGGDRDE